LATEAQEAVEREEEEPVSASSSSSSSSKSRGSAEVPKDSDIALALKSLAEESLQISELSEMEKTYATEVIGQLKQLIEPLSNTFHIKPTSLSKTDSSIQDVVLTPQGIITVMHSHGTINSRPLETFSTEILMRILSEVIPEAKRILVERRQKITGRVGSLEKIAREFRKLPTQAPGPKQGRVGTKGQATANRAAEPQVASTPIQEDALKATIER
jgi:hypothetical protein